jgi:hypothetical protein
MQGTGRPSSHAAMITVVHRLADGTGNKIFTILYDT